MITSLEIKPNKGFGEIKFGDYIDNIVTLLGEPEEIDTFEDDEEVNMLILHYWDLGISVFSEGGSKQVVSGFETDHPDVTLFGTKIIGLSENEIKNLMAKNGYREFETETEEEGKRISYDELLLDFYFRNDKLAFLSWDALLNEKGEIVSD
jgi:hypothetical protein